MGTNRPVFFAAALRFILGLVPLVALPQVYPGLTDHRWIFIGYLGWALFAQVLIWKGIGGFGRTMIDGLVDIALVTFIVHRVGSVSTMMVSVYMLEVILNTLVIGRRAGIILAILTSLAYTGIVVAEALGWLPYAPDAPEAARVVRPTLGQGLVFAGIASGITVMIAAVVGFLIHLIRLRESQLVQANAQLEELSQRDPLTQLFNRRHLLRRIQDELAWVNRGRPMALVMIDLDRFKKVNDERGHLQGDALLRKLAQALSSHSRATDVAGRFGGDEFVVLLPDTNVEQASTAAERLREAIHQQGLEFDAELPVTASVGFAHARATDTPADLIRRADENAYRAKQQGGDRVVGEPVDDVAQ
ncbi:MAG: GGDEF domain-containing protein [Myxococcota bacterium]